MADKQKKIARIHERLDAMFANPVQPDPGDEWPTLTQAQVNEFADLVHSIANLAFCPDWKDRSVLNIIVNDKKAATLHTFYELRDKDPYDAELSEREFLEQFSSNVRQASSMISTGERMISRYAEIARWRASKLETAAETKNDFDGLRALLEADKFTEFETEAASLLEKYDPPRYVGIGEAAKTPYNRNGTYRKVPPELQDLLDLYGVARQSAAGGKDVEIDAAVAALVPLVEKAEGLVGVDHKGHGSYEGSFEEALDAVRQAMHPVEYRFGRRVLAPITRRFNRANEEHRVLLRLRERGQKVVAA